MSLFNYFTALIFSGFSIFACAPKSDSVHFSHQSSNLTLSYNSSLIYPGGRLGIELPVKSICLTNTKKNGQVKNFVKDRFIAVHLSWYHHPAFHDNVYLTTGWTMRKTNPKGFFTEFSPEIGLSRTFLDGTTYTVDDEGNIKIEKCAGYFYALLSAGCGMGYDFEKIKKKPVIIFSKLNFLMMFPYNNTIYVRPALEIGFIYRPSDFLGLKVNVENKIK